MFFDSLILEVALKQPSSFAFSNNSFCLVWFGLVCLVLDLFFSCDSVRFRSVWFRLITRNDFISTNCLGSIASDGSCVKIHDKTGIDKYHEY